MTDRTLAQITVINAATTSSGPTVDAELLGTVVPGLRYPVWYTPRLGDLVVVDWVGSQPFVSTAFA